MNASVTVVPAALRELAKSPAGAASGFVVVSQELRRLWKLVPAWEELTRHALEPNVFYEHWMLRPALRAYAFDQDVRLVLVRSRGTAGAGAGSLAGLFPLRFVPRVGRFGVSVAQLWQHPHCYSGTPLVRADCAGECIRMLLTWLRREAGVKLLELPCLSGDGPFHARLTECCRELGLTSSRTGSYTRGLWRKSDAAQGPGSAVSGALRRRLRRLERRLAERGPVAHVHARPGDDIARWVDEFLRVEASGWKGVGGSALACSAASRRYFAQIVTAAFQRERLLMVGLDYRGQPIARRCAFIAGQGSFAFKTAYDERFAAHSPGAILEIDSLAQLEERPQVRWMDSCAAPDNLLINRITNDRRAICGLDIAVGPLRGLAFTALRLRRWTQRRLLRRQTPDLPSEGRSQ